MFDAPGSNAACSRLYNMPAAESAQFLFATFPYLQPPWQWGNETVKIDRTVTAVLRLRIHQTNQSIDYSLSRTQEHEPGPKKTLTAALSAEVHLRNGSQTCSNASKTRPRPFSVEHFLRWAHRVRTVCVIACAGMHGGLCLRALSWDATQLKFELTWM